VLDNFADLWELVSDAAGERLAIVHGEAQRNWADFDARSSRLAAALAEQGVSRGTTVAINLRNSIENLETLFAAFKLRAVPFNVNYRYRERELTYLINDAKPAVIVYDHAFGDRVLPSIELSGLSVRPIEVYGDADPTEGTLSFEGLIAAHEPAPRIERDGDDDYIVYTGGTTGYPKGVVWAQKTSLMPQLFAGGHLKSAADFVGFVEEQDSAQARLVIAPLMHASGFLGATNALATGGPVVFCASTSLNPDEILTLIQRYRVRNFGVIGDAIAKPILEALERAEAEGRPYDLSSVETVSNTGGIWSAPVKKGFLRYGDFKISDGLSATEGPGFAIAESTRASEIETAKFRLGPTARIINEQGKDVVPGSGEVGMLATTGRLPKGYLNDPVRTAQAWPTIDGVRYSVPGDLATIEADGTVTLLGRGSEVVNTGGEKVFVEEVETAILTHPAVRDTLVIGLADERWGSRVTAVVALREGSSATDREIIDHVGQELADYKRPRQVVFVAEIPRSPTGKADRPAAKRLAEEAEAGV
jgi:acyl-CoA synthetase (AMP-forming)/AMP-acid ligase II